MQLDEPTRARDPRRASRPVFLSYRSADDRNRDNRRDSGIADASRRLIEAEGIPVWYARTSVHRGDVWAAEIEKGLEDALVLVCLLSEDYLTSGHTTGEHSIYRMRHSRDGKLSPTRLVVCANVGLNDDWKTRDDPLSHHTQAFRSYEPVDLQGSSIVTGVREILRRIKAHLGAQGWRPERGFVED